MQGKKAIRSLHVGSHRRRTSLESQLSDEYSLEEALLSARPSGTGHNARPSYDFASSAAAAVAEVDAERGEASRQRTATEGEAAAAAPGGEGEARDSRRLWRLARTRIGLSNGQRQAGAEGAAGAATPPSVTPGSTFTGRTRPSTDPRQYRRSQSEKIAGTFVNVLLQGVLGSGGILAAEASLTAEAPPRAWAPASDARTVWRMLTASWLNLLLVCLPVGIAAGALKLNATLIFLTNFLALVPMALVLGEVTEDLAIRFGDVIGGLFSATFGNVVEMILSIAALHKGLYLVVATSLIGSILSNLLLVLGMCFLFGGFKYQQQSFSTLANKVGSSLLFLACIAIIIPSAARLLYGGAVITEATTLNLSHAIAILLIFIYGCYLLFQLKTHAHLFSSDADSTETPALSLSGSVAMLSSITIAVAFCSEYLTGAIEEVSETSGVNQAFLGLIVLPIAGNACEHITAVFVAVKNKMDLAIGVALGSSIQIAIFVIPVTVLAGWAMGRPFTLDFDTFSVLMLTVSVIMAYFVSSDGSSNWLLGVQLVATYCLIGLVFLLEKEPKAGGQSRPGAAVLAASAAPSLLRL